MIPSAELRVVFRVAAGPRRGLGHLVRCLSLARAMGVRPLLSLKGGDQVGHAALSLGGDVLSDATTRVIARLRPDVVVVDDPNVATARRWVDAARKSGALVVTIRDHSTGHADADVVIDATDARQAPAGKGRVELTGARFAILGSRTRRRTGGRRADRSAADRNVLVALNGPRKITAQAIAEAIAAADPHARIRIAAGFGVPANTGSSRISWVEASRGLGRELERATVAVVDGGTSMYEACAAGVPSVAVPAVSHETPAVKALARKGAMVAMPFKSSERRAAAEVVALLDDPRRRALLARRSTELIDGHGATRAAAAVLSFVQGRRM